MSGPKTNDPPTASGATTRRGPLALVTAGAGTAPEAVPEELSLRVLLPLMRYVQAQFGQQATVRLAEEAGIDADALRRENSWTSHQRFERLLAGARKLVSSDQEFMRACAHDMVRLYGPMMLVIRCVSMERAYRMMAGTGHLVTRISAYDPPVTSTQTSIRLRYRTTRAESRLMCLSRQAQLRAGPTLYWGMAPAALEEHSCVAHGDDCCDYTLRWYEPVRWRGPLFGALAGLLLALVLRPLAWPATWVVWMVCGSLGLLAGLLLEQRRLVGDHLRFAEGTNRELEHLAIAHARAVDEVLALHQRERQWSEEREAAIEARSARLDRVVEQLQDRAEPRRDKLRNLSHDINNPLAVLMGVAGYLRRSGTNPEDIEDAAQTLETAVGQLSDLVRELATIVTEEPAVTADATPIDVASLSDRMRRQLRATVVGRDIRVTVFQTREAPSQIRAVVPVLERVVDNILTNAAKYTERGSIVVEVGGTPGHLLVKVSDTGRGIGPERLEQVLLHGGPDPNPPKGGSRGAGLGIVARLLDSLGGRLEIMSEPGQGTTLWVYIPAEPPERSDRARDAEPLAGVIERVVRVRPKPTSGGGRGGGD